MTAFGFGAEEFDEGLSEAVDRARGMLRDLYHLGEHTMSEAAEGFGGFGARPGGPFPRPERGGFGGCGGFGGRRESAPHPGHGPGAHGGSTAHAEPGRHPEHGGHGPHGGARHFGAHQAPREHGA